MQQHGSKYFNHRPLPDPGYEVNRAKFNFFRTWSCCIIIKFKGITKCSSMEANILTADPSLTLGMRSIGQNLTFSEHDHVAYQFLRNHKMQQHGSKYFNRRPLPDPGH